jgi:hypothetical protein
MVRGMVGSTRTLFANAIVSMKIVLERTALKKMTDLPIS